jgi:hypothetical protein
MWRLTIPFATRNFDPSNRRRAWGCLELGPYYSLCHRAAMDHDLLCEAGKKMITMMVSTETRCITQPTSLPQQGRPISVVLLKIPWHDEHVEIEIT